MSGMQCLVTDLITSITADSAAAAYPVANLRDEHPAKPWTADGADTATLTCMVAAGASGLGIAGTNAQSAVVLIEDPIAVEIVDTAYIADTAYFITMTAGIDFELFSSGGSGMIMAGFDRLSMAAKVSITLAAASGDTVKAGVVHIGEVKGVQRNPSLGLGQGGQTYSIKKILSNGARWTKTRKNVRTFTGRAMVARDRDFFTFMDDIARTVDLEPRFWWITNLAGTDWLVFAELTGWPAGTHDGQTWSVINFSLIEVL